MFLTLSLTGKQHFDVDLSFPTFITAEKKRVTKVQFSHWIPFYKPLLTVTISDESGMMHNSLVSIYLKIVAVGNHFFPVSIFLKEFQGSQLSLFIDSSGTIKAMHN